MSQVLGTGLSGKRRRQSDPWFMTEAYKDPK